jgi:hypothetical protein
VDEASEGMAEDRGETGSEEAEVVENKQPADEEAHEKVEG